MRKWGVYCNGELKMETDNYAYALRAANFVHGETKEHSEIKLQERKMLKIGYVDSYEGEPLDTVRVNDVMESIGESGEFSSYNSGSTTVYFIHTKLDMTPEDKKTLFNFLWTTSSDELGVYVENEYWKIPMDDVLLTVKYHKPQRETSI